MSEEFNQYLRTVGQLQGSIEAQQRDASALPALLDLEAEKKEEGSWRHFFQAEKAFYKADYDEALSHYLQARDVPHFHFFCYRCSAYLSHSKKQTDKALRFFSKALTFLPQDYATLKLGVVLMEETGQEDRVEELRQALHTVHAEDKPAINTIDKAIEPQPKEPDQMKHHPQFIEIEKNERPADLGAEKILEMRMHNFQQRRTELLHNYMQARKPQAGLQDECLFMLNGSAQQQKIPLQFLLNDPLMNHSTGFFLRWKGLGIAVNPGHGFLDNLHAQGLSISDINAVIVNRGEQEAWAEIQRLYDLTVQLNKLNAQFHLIHYYLHPKAFQRLSHTLKAHFRQEKGSVNRLELFIDSPDVETIALSDEVSLNYFSAMARESLFDQDESTSESRVPLAIRLDLKESDRTIRLGYVSGTPWNPLMALNLGHCDLLIAGFGSTQTADFAKISYNENCLGYYGTLSLVEAVQPKLLLCTEFEGREGDLRIEVTKRLRQELGGKSTVLPADCRLSLDLKQLAVPCSVTGELLPADQILVIKLSEAFGQLSYLSPSCIC